MSTDDTVLEVKPCAYCGRPVPQRAAAGRPFRYCRDNDGACQAAARNSRMRHRNSPGLAGQVAKAHEVVERLEQVALDLSDALSAELSPAGVERQLAQVRAEAANLVATAQAERESEALRLLAERDEARAAARTAEHERTVSVDAARAETANLQAQLDKTLAEARSEIESAREQARTEITEARDQARSEIESARERARTEIAEAHEQAGRQVQAAQAQAQARVEQAHSDRDLAVGQANDRAAAAESERDQAAEQAARAAQEATAARAETQAHQARAAEATGERDQALRQAAAAQALADASGATADHARAAADGLRAELARAQSQRDAAVAEAAHLRDRADQLTMQVGQLAATLTQLTARLAVPLQQPAAGSGGGDQVEQARREDERQPV